MALHCFVQWKSALLTPLIYVFCIWCLSYSPQWASCAQDMMPECPSSLLRQVIDRWSFLLKVSSRPVAKQTCSTSSRAFPVVDSSLSVSAQLTGSLRSPRAKPSQGWMGFVPWPSLSSFTHQARKDGKKEEKESALDSIPTGLQVTNWTNWGQGFVKSAAWLQSENEPCSQMLPTVSCRTTQKGFHQLLGLLPGMGAPTLLSAQSTCFTCILFLHLWAAGLQTAAATYMASGEVLAYLRWSKIQQWWPSRQINIFCIAAEIPFPPILTLNSAFMQLCSNDYRFGKELQSEKEKKAKPKYSHPPEQLGAAAITINSCPVKTVFTHPKQIHERPPCRGLWVLAGSTMDLTDSHTSEMPLQDPGLAVGHWFWPYNTSLVPKNKQESLQRKPWASWQLVSHGNDHSIIPLRLQLPIPRLLLLDQTWFVLAKLNLPQVQQCMW